MDAPDTSASDTSASERAAELPRFELTLKKHWIGWYPKPTVVFDGRGNPAQWGTGTWRVRTDGSTTVAVYLFNRMWRFGEAEVLVGGRTPAALTYTAPWLPFGAGRIR